MEQGKVKRILGMHWALTSQKKKKKKLSGDYGMSDPEGGIEFGF